ncbi:MAG: hypothetical protein PHS30_07475 [Bacteroidales bacterium]|nr:hypothetical protein [Bacteroidales bacterium]
MSTFELFLQLPLFKGIEMDELFSMIPKINLDFENFQPGEIIFDRKMEPRGLVYLLKGQVSTDAGRGNQDIAGPALLSYSGLFGTDRQYIINVRAKNSCSTLNIDTKSLLFLLRHCPVFLSNYLNLLSDTINKLYFEKETVIIV